MINATPSTFQGFVEWILRWGVCWWWLFQTRLAGRQSVALLDISAHYNLRVVKCAREKATRGEGGGVFFAGAGSQRSGIEWTHVWLNWGNLLCFGAYNDSVWTVCLPYRKQPVKDRLPLSFMKSEHSVSTRDDLILFLALHCQWWSFRSESGQQAYCPQHRWIFVICFWWILGIFGADYKML